MAINESIIGSAIIEVRADMDRLSKDFKKAQATSKASSAKIARQTDSIGRSAAGAAKKIATIGAAYAAIRGAMSLVRMVKESLAFADSIGKTAAKLSISTDALQEFRFAAEQSGVATTALDMGFQRFARRAQEAQAGTGEAKDAIKELGLALFDSAGNARRAEDLFADAMEALAGTDATRRLRLAFKLFDSEGVALINLADNFDALRQKARDMGVVMDRDIIANAEESKAKLDALSASIKKETVEAFVALAPVIEMGARAFRMFAIDVGNAVRRLKDLDDLVLSELVARQGKVLQDLAKLDAILRDRGSPFREGGLRAGKMKSLALEFDAIQKLIDARKEQRAQEVSPLQELKDTQALSVDKLKQVADLGKARAALHQDFLRATGQEIQIAEDRHERTMQNLRAAGASAQELRDAESESLAILDSDISRIRQKEQDLIDGLAEGTQQLAEHWKDAADFVARTFSDALAQVVLTGENAAKAIADAFIRELISRAIGIGVRSLIQSFLPLLGFLGSGGAGIPVPPGGIPGRPAAHGGFRSGATLVGERGPELVNMGPSAHVTSNAAIQSALSGRSGGASNVVVNVNNFGKEQVEIEKGFGTDGEVQIDIIIARAAAKDIRRGGVIAQEIGARFGSRRVGGAV